MMNVLSFSPVVSPTLLIYSLSFINTSKPLRTPKPVAETRPCIPVIFITLLDREILDDPLWVSDILISF